MGTSHHRRRRALVAASVATCALALGVIEPSSASADAVNIPGPPPAEVMGEFRGCPQLDEFDGAPLYCLRAKLYDGEFKIGKTVASIGAPLEFVLGIGTFTGDDGQQVFEFHFGDPDGPTTGGSASTAAASSGVGSFAPIRIQGGILGMPELDPLISLAPDLLGASVAPAIGTPAPAAAPGEQPAGASIALIEWLSGIGRQVALRLPLSISVDNLLLGNRCRIPSFSMVPTTGTTTPPAGATPMSGDLGRADVTYYGSGTSADGVWRRVGARLVDNTFAVPGAAQCDLLLGDLLNQPAGLFDSLLDLVAGLPSAAGNNHVAFSVDTTLVDYTTLADLMRAPLQLNFGTLRRGQSSEPKTITITNTGFSTAHSVPIDEVRSAPSSANPDLFTVVSDDCSGHSLGAGESCTISIAATVPDEFTGTPPFVAASASWEIVSAGRVLSSDSLRASVTVLLI